MKQVCSYYIVDEVAESVVGCFDAPNDDMAVRTFQAGLDKNDALAKFSDSLKMYKSKTLFPIFETYQEIVDSEYCEFVK